jgi:hypothetical protein
MAVHYLTHTINFNTPVTEQVRIELHKKDVIPAGVTELKGTYAKRQVLSGAGDGSDTILSTELVFGLWLREDSGVDFDDFIVSFHDEWKVVLYCDNQIEFVGFMTPNEGQSSLIGIRKELNLSASDNLGLIKKAPLKRYNGAEFREMNRVIDYICGALAATGLQLNVVLYSNIYESSMPDRNVDPNSDTFNQAKLDYRLFMSDPLTFKYSYEALEIILGEGFSVEQWQGKWVIQRLGEMQGSEGPKIWYTEYAYDGLSIIDAKQYLNDPAIVDKDQTLHPVAGDLTGSCNYSVKKAKHTYTYTPWPELPKNNTFERGAFMPGIGNPDQKAYAIDDWFFGRTLPGTPSTFPQWVPWSSNVPAPTTEQAYRLSTYNIYGVETAREIVLENGSSPGHTFLHSTPFPIKEGDKLDINFDFKRNPGGNGTMNYAMIWVSGASGSTWRLNNNNTIDGGKPFRWELASALRFVSKFYQGEDWQDWSSLAVECPPAPESGDLYVAFMNYDSTNTKVYYRNFQVVYHPFVAGGYIEAKGDYWLTEQNAAYLDEIDKEVYISDSEIKVLQGALFRNDGVTLTTRSWHRLNVAENRGYKELINIARFNMSYRRMWEISGTFGGVGYYPGNNQAIRLPLGFHKHFIFPGIPKVVGTLFQLVPPLTVDYTQGEIKANFRESYTPGLGDGDQLGNNHEFKYKF